MLLTFSWKKNLFFLFNFWSFFNYWLLINARKSGYCSKGKIPPPKDLFSWQFNPCENLLRTITLNISMRKIESPTRKQDIRRISYRNSPSAKFHLKIKTLGTLLPMKNNIPGKYTRRKSPPPWKMYAHFPITNTIGLLKQWANFIT